MAIDTMVNTKPKKKKSTFSIIKGIFKKEKTPVDLSKFDPYTGDKIAQQIVPNNTPNSFKDFNVAKQEVYADASRKQTSPIDWFHSLKAGTVGTSGGFVLSNLLKLEGRSQGLVSLGLGGLIAGLDAKRQLGNYNRQMAARELLANKKTPRSLAYYKLIKDKYNLKN